MNFLKKNCFDDIDTNQFQQLLQETFKRKLKPDYFKRSIEAIFIESSYAGCIVLSNIGGFIYIDKFAVHPSKQGQGLGSQLWKEMKNHYSQFCWRSKVTSPFKTFFLDECSSHIIFDNWVVYGHALSLTPFLTDQLIQLPESFSEFLPNV